MKADKSLILLIDDEVEVLEPLQELIEGEGYTVITAEDGEKGLQLFETQHPDLVITDIYLPNLNGIDLLKTIKKSDPTLPVMMLSAYDHSIDSLRLRADDYLQKPPDYQYLFYSINKLLKARADAFELDRLKKEEIEREALLSAMSCLVHELITPLNGILGSLQFLKDGELSLEEQDEFIDTSISSTKKAVEFIRTFTSYQSLTKNTLQKQTFNYYQSIEALVSEMNTEFDTFRGNDLQIILECLNKDDINFFGDEKEITHSVRELLTNAARWTNKGTIGVLVKKNEESIETIVQDTGTGIETQYWNQVFLPGQNASNPLNHSSIDENPYEFSKSGYGFGLAYVKRLIEFHHGTISFTSEFKKGSTFSFSFPEKPPF